jgi:Leucine-rich repeat (LRR) protein
VLVNRLRVLREMNYQAMNVEANPSEAYGEFVVQQTGQVLPRYVLKCRRKDDTILPIMRPPEPEIFPDLHKDLQALVQFFEDTNGVNWTQRTNWVQNADLSSWQGPHYPIGLDSSGSVERVRLPGNNLHGTFSNSLGTLEMLQILDLSDNKLSGEVPVSLGYLKHIKELYIDKNSLSGELSLLLVLRKCLVARQGRIGDQRAPSSGFLLPSQWGVAGSREENFIRKEDSSVGGVKKLLLGRSSLSGSIPPKMMAYFAPRGAMREGGGVSTEVHRGELSELDMSNNVLTGSIPQEVGLMVSLQRIDLSHNNLSGCLPSEISMLSNLTDLMLSHNMLEGAFPSFVGSMTELRNLDLSSNKFTGPIPADVFGDMRLELGNNFFHDVLPPSISQLSKLILFSCESNHITGQLPTSYGQLRALRGLNVSSNKLTGQFPESIAALTTLQRLNVADNEITGNLPLFSAYQKLRIINLSNNMFTGPVPEAYNLLTSLETLFLNGNPELSVQGAKHIVNPRVELML